MIDQTETATPSTETQDTAAAEAAQPPGDALAPAPADDGAEQADLDRVAEPDPAAAPDDVGEIASEPEPAAADLEPAAEPEPEADTEADVPSAVVAAATGPRTVGRLVADVLRAAGVRYAFTVPGESFLGLLEGLTAAGIRIVTTRHEGAASFMAEAYGQLTGRPAACLATRAVGAANLAIGVHTARQNSTPMFVLVGQVEREFQGREAFQEVDQVGSFGQLAKWSAEPRNAGEVPAALAEAVTQALGGRPGPVLL